MSDPPTAESTRPGTRVTCSSCLGLVAAVLTGYCILIPIACGSLRWVAESDSRVTPISTSLEVPQERWRTVADTLINQGLAVVP